MVNKNKKVDNNNLKKVENKINAVLLVLNLIKNNFEFEKNEMTNNEIKQWVLANELISNLLLDLLSEKMSIKTKNNGGKK